MTSRNRNIMQGSAVKAATAHVIFFLRCRAARTEFCNDFRLERRNLNGHTPASFKVPAEYDDDHFREVGWTRGSIKSTSVLEKYYARFLHKTNWNRKYAKYAI